MPASQRAFLMPTPNRFVNISSINAPVTDHKGQNLVFPFWRNLERVVVTVVVSVVVNFRGLFGFFSNP